MLLRLQQHRLRTLIQPVPVSGTYTTYPDKFRQYFNNYRQCSSRRCRLSPGLVLRDPVVTVDLTSQAGLPQAKMTFCDAASARSLL
ncbi:hypothetical protein RRG08_029887 [Elysia crispata]|uniref:Uncharacterized protein n=1 Tax=Elysia crispata TaxID=231223 RepID=A0AAE1D0F8_9GAST|nr:hypothetical protein RRG08_029887 [Elysia crispata]